MLNFLSILYDLSAKVTLDRVDPYYAFNPKCRVNVAGQTRLKLDMESSEAFTKTLGK